MKREFNILPFSFVFRDSSTQVTVMECHFIIRDKMAGIGLGMLLDVSTETEYQEAVIH
jgi:hypothetical protein